MDAQIYDISTKISIIALSLPNKQEKKSFIKWFHAFTEDAEQTMLKIDPDYRASDE